MSRIGKKTVTVPANVKIAINGRVINVEGPKGKLSFEHRPEVKVHWDQNEKSIAASIDPKDHENRLVRALWGTTRAQIQNMILGVTQGYSKTMEVVGVGWQAEVTGNKLKLTLGFASPVIMPIPEGLKINVEKQFVKIEGTNKQLVGQFAAEMRTKRKPEPYNGKGVKYATEVIKKKAGKSFGS